MQPTPATALCKFIDFAESCSFVLASFALYVVIDRRSVLSMHSINSSLEKRRIDVSPRRVGITLISSNIFMVAMLLLLSASQMNVYDYTC